MSESSTLAGADVFPGSTAAATAAIRRYCGWHIAPVKKETIILDGRYRYGLALPTKKLVELISVEVSDGAGAWSDITDSVSWSDAGMLSRNGAPFPGRFRSVRVTFGHGYTLEEAADVVAVAVELGKRASAGASNIVRKQAGPFSVTFGSQNGVVGGLGLLEQEKAILESYRVKVHLI
ncbi:hypothetical protein [Winkia sp. UMB0889B]|uniref:hypothetical protein n=1 Tax=Winkia sp. UMB0889B TaxID=3046315 RepID=UPI0025563E76|nr:hypothetical protein [Winkia sp. UMB0889B]MDK7904862.1 hypothetical protein [Winkia sp. UMB0889B]